MTLIRAATCLRTYPRHFQPCFPFAFSVNAYFLKCYIIMFMAYCLLPPSFPHPHPPKKFSRAMISVLLTEVFQILYNRAWRVAGAQYTCWKTEEEIGLFFEGCLLALQSFTQMQSYNTLSSAKLRFLSEEPGTQEPATHGARPLAQNEYPSTWQAQPGLSTQQAQRTTLPRILGFSRGVHFSGG